MTSTQRKATGIIVEAGLMKKSYCQIGAGLINDFIHNILSVPYCPLPFCPLICLIIIGVVVIFIMHMISLLVTTSLWFLQIFRRKWMIRITMMELMPGAQTATWC